MAPLATLYEFMLRLQPESTGGAADSAGAAGGGAGAPVSPLDGCAGGSSTMLMLVVMLAFMYFFVLRPEQKRAKEREVTLKALMKGDIVRTNSGIRGEIVSFANDNRDVILEIAPKTRINVFRAQILGKEAPGTESGTTSPADKSDKADKADKKKD
jgi:preprotein translocase subunit YajC